MKISKTVGIDLGTTNSVIAMTDQNDTNIISYESKNKQKTIPSVVSYDPLKKEIIVGNKAFNRRGTIPEPIVSIKTKMGTQEKGRLGTQEVIPEQVSAYILSECKKLMYETMNKDNSNDEYIIDRAVITVPAYFSLNAIEATRKAGELAGLKVEEILSEPTAAAIYYSWKNNIEDGNFMVFDLGGGTFDVSIVSKIAGIPMVSGISGNNFLGGDNFDKELARDIITKLNESDEGYELSLDLDNIEDRLKFTKLVLEAECIKKELSKKEDVYWEKSGVFSDENGLNVNIAMEFERAGYENIISALLESTIPECEKALAEAEKNSAITLEDIDYILMVGGSSKIPLVQKIVKDNFCNPQKIHAKCLEPIIYEPDMAVGYGAAIRASCYGTKIYNNDMTVSAQIDTLGGSNSKNYSFSGKVEAVENKMNLKDAKIKVSNAEGTFNTEKVLDAGGCFSIDNMPLKENSITGFNFEIISKNGETLIDFNKNIVHSGDFVDTGDVELDSSILPKTLNIEIYNKATGNVEKHELIEKSTPLPIEKDFTFYSNEHTTEMIRIKLFENYTLLKEIVVPFDTKLAEGTPVNLHLNISKNVVITATGEVGSKEFSAVVEPPKSKVPTELEYVALKKEFEDATSILKPGKKAVFEAQKRNICIHIEEGFKDKEHQRIIEYMDKLRELVDNLKIELKPMEPQKEVFDKLANDNSKDIEELKARGKRIDVSSENVISVQNEGHKAYDESDQPKLTECYKKLNQIRGVIDEVIRGEMPAPPPWQIAMLLCIQYVQPTIQDLLNAPNLKMEDRTKIKKMADEVLILLPQISPDMNDNDAYDIIGKCQKMYAELQNINDGLHRPKITEVPSF